MEEAMDLDSLRCSVQRNYNFHFSYTLHMKYKQLEWYIEKSFSDFLQLQEALIYLEYSDVPLLPDVAVSSGLDPLSDVVNAEEQLEAFIQEVLRRPDTRGCEEVLTFCDMFRRLSQLPQPVMAKLITESNSCHLSVSDVRYLKEDKLIIVAYEEKTVLSKIGRMWSIIEQDNLGALRVYRIEGDVTNGITQLLEKYFHNKIRAIEYSRELSTLLVAKDDGCVDSFRLTPDASEFEFTGKIVLHSAPILAMNAVGNLCFTSGYDDSIKAVDIEEKQIISGGKLTKRLNGEKLLTSTALSPRTIMIGTTSNVIYTYYMTKEVPTFVDSCKVPQPMTIRKIQCTSSNIFVAHGNCVSCFGYSRHSLDKLRDKWGSGKKPSDANTTEMTDKSLRNRKGQDIYAASHPENETVSFPMAIRSAQFSVNKPESSFSSYNVYDMALRSSAKQLLVAYDEVVAIWCVVKGVMLYSWYAHRNAQVVVLRILDQDGLVLTGGSDGSVRIWRLPDTSLLKLWNPVKA